MLQGVKEGERITLLQHNASTAILTPIQKQQKSNIQETIDSLIACYKDKIIRYILKDINK